MKKSVICLYCVIFSLISVSFCLAQDDTIIDPADWSSARSSVQEEPAVEEEPVITVVVDEPAVTIIVEEPVVTHAPAHAPVHAPAVPETHDLSAAIAAAAAAAAESAAAAKSAATAAADFAAEAKSAAAAAAAAESAATAASATAAYAPPPAPQYESPSPPPPSAPPAYLHEPAPSAPHAPHAKPQPPVRTDAPTVTFVFPQTAPQQTAPQTAPQAIPSVPPASGNIINVIPKMPDPYSSGVYRVQVGSFSNTGLAQQCFQRLQSAGFSPFYETYGGMNRVLIIGIRAAEMEWVVQRLAAAGFSEVWVREER